MSEQLNFSEKITNSSELKDIATRELANEFHEDWRKTRQNEDGTFEPRIKQTSDSVWIEKHGTDQVDIANSSYDELPADWQAENKAAAEVIVDIFTESNGNIDLDNEDTLNQVGGVVHEAWLSRNDWARGGDLDVAFEQLPADEQSKDIAQVIIAQNLFN